MKNPEEYIKMPDGLLGKEELVRACRYLTFFDGLLRAVWWEYLDPARDLHAFWRRLHTWWEQAFLAQLQAMATAALPVGSRMSDFMWGVPLPPDFMNSEWLQRLHTYDNMNVMMMDAIRDLPDAEPHVVYLRQRWEEMRNRVVGLTEEMVGSLRDISGEVMVWLKKHPNSMDRLAWEAFEKIVAEVFAARGFKVDLTGRVRDNTADVIAVRTDFGAETRYLIECKKYTRTNRIGLDIVNGVVGAAKRANADHAFLVTTSSFTRDVTKQEVVLRDLRVHLRDGDAIVKWLSDYTPRSDGGLWLDQQWKETI